MSTIQKSIRNELGRIAQSYQSDYDVARANELSVQSRMSELLSLTARTNGDRVALRSLQSSAETYRSVYENFLRRYTQAVQDQSFPVSEARVITAATPPLRKSWPQSNLVLGGAGLLGIGLGFLVAFVRETLDRGIRTTAQLRMVTGLNCVGMLPGLGRGRRSSVRRAAASNADANSADPVQPARHSTPRADTAGFQVQLKRIRALALRHSCRGRSAGNAIEPDRVRFGAPG